MNATTLDKQTFWQDKSPTPSWLNIPSPLAWVNQGIKLTERLLTYQTQFNEQQLQRQDFLNQAKKAYSEQRHDNLVNNATEFSEDLAKIQTSLQHQHQPAQLWQAYLDYCVDSSQRLIQTLDILRARGDIFLEHEAAGCPPVLDYDYEIIQDAAEFERPCNYVLLRILPPNGIQIDNTKRPYIIIDPRAGHGGGIGGFKHDSQVGVALSGGHPVYFVAFKRMPEPTQTIADVCHAEAQFFQTVIERHPKSDQPVIIGNCQGGWAILILAATHPEVKGPIVLNGSPVSAWSGQVGINPMRYKAGISGGTWLSMLTADLGNGVFDGAWLVNNFEQLNPSRNYVGKYYDLYKNPLPNKARFLEFERWWGGFFLMNEAEIRWIVENIFVGNRLARNTAQLETGVNIDLKTIKAPIIIFASYGDNITPPPQAINWVLDTYSDEREIEICGQRIVYMIHETVGHLGIFVSSSVAKREHQGIATLLETIEIMPPGLYELVIEDIQGHGDNLQFEVNLVARTFNDLKQIDSNRQDEQMFRAIHRLSKAQAQGYETFIRPFVKSMSNEITAQMLRTMHPLRLQRSLWSSKNPLANSLTYWGNLPTDHLSTETSSTGKTPTHPATAQQTTTHQTADTSRGKKQLEHMTGTNAAAPLPAKQPVLNDNIFMQLEKLWIDTVIHTLDYWRDWQGFAQEQMFFNIWAMPWLVNYGQKEQSRHLIKSDSLTEVSAVKAVVKRLYEGGFVEAVLRMMILVSKNPHGKIDDNEMAKFAKTLAQPPFSELSEEQLAKIMQEQTIMVRFAEDQAIEALPRLLKTAADRQRAKDLLSGIIADSDNLPLHLQVIMTKLSNKLNMNDLTA